MVLSGVGKAKSKTDSFAEDFLDRVNQCRFASEKIRQKTCPGILHHHLHVGKECTRTAEDLELVAI